LKVKIIKIITPYRLQS